MKQIEIKDDLQILADFMYEIILKYSDKVDLDSLPDPDEFFLMKDIENVTKVMAEWHKEDVRFDIEYVVLA